MVRQIEVADGKFQIGAPHLALIAGPCLVEDYDTTLDIALRLAELTTSLEMPLIFKASYDKANRTSASSPRGPGWREGLEILAAVKEASGLPLLTDVHETVQVAEVAQVADILQIPAFLCRQTDLLVEAGRTGRPVNIKKGQFLSPADIQHAIEKVTSTGNQQVMLTERGTSFGYNNLVVDMRGLAIMRTFGYPVIFDATHSVQLPGGAGGASGGQRQFVAPLARAAVATGVDGIFLEVHPQPDEAPCDGPNMVPLDELRPLLEKLQAIHKAAWE
jgi:2-dehydro-3-deoxyphosphooctonate aldolase (KDO 8-P synthase)